MRVVLTNNSKNITVTFQDHSEFKNDKGYKNLYGQCYTDSVNNDLVFKATHWVGFLGNNKINPYADRGAQEDGINFYSNWFSERTISWEFTNVFSSNGTNFASPNNMLNSLLMEKNDIIRVDVYATNHYYQDFFVTDNTDTEKGLIELKGAYGNEIFWNSDTIDKTDFFNFYGTKRQYITKRLPSILLTREEYPFKKSIFTNYMTKTKIKVGGNNTGTWTSFKVTNSINNKEIIINNVFNDLYLNISEKGIVTNQNGLIRNGCLTGDMMFSNGINDLTIVINNQTNYMLAQENLPLDFNFTFDYVSKHVGVE